MRPLAELVILITGATDGLGKAVAMQLARTGATLLLHGRDEARGQRMLGEIRAQTCNTHLQWYRADFPSLRRYERWLNDWFASRNALTSWSIMPASGPPCREGAHARRARMVTNCALRSITWRRFC